MRNIVRSGCLAFVVALLVCNAHALTIGEVTAPASVEKYGKLEITVPLADIAANTKPYEPNPALNGLNLSASFTHATAGSTTIYGFFDGSNWKVRFSPTAEGAWSFAINAEDSGGAAVGISGGFDCAASSHKGFVLLDGRNLRFQNGESFVAVGHNNGWQDDVERPLFSQMPAKGLNLMSFWMAQPWCLPSWNRPRSPLENIEGGLGNYDQAASQYIDGLVNRAEAAGVYLLPSIWAHDQLCNNGHTNVATWPSEWEKNPYNTICTPTDFYKTSNAGVDTEQWRLQKNFYRYILARWGYSRSIAGWVGVAEIDGTDGYHINRAQTDAWSVSLRTYFVQNDKYRHSAAAKYPMIISTVNNTTYDPGLDVRACDSYSSQTNNTAVALTIATDTRNMLATGKPGIHTEWGGYVNGGATQPTHLHNGIWAGISAGAPMVPIVWCDGGGWPMLDSASGLLMQDHLKHLSNFISGIDYIADPATTTATLAFPTGHRGWGMKNGSRGFLWIQKTATGNLSGGTVTVSGLTAGKYTVQWFDGWTSGATPLTTTTVNVTSTSLGLVIPALAQKDIACKFSPNTAPVIVAGASATPNPTPDTTTFLSVSGSDDAGESALTYSWSATGPASVSFSANGSNAAKNSIATFSQAGEYSITVTATDGGALTSTSNVVVTVVQTPSAVVVSPSSASILINASQQFTASVLDQFGVALSGQTFTWSATNGYAIDPASGLFLAGTTAGSSTVTALSGGGLSGTASVTVASASNVPPSVTLTAPASVKIKTNFVLSASASDSDGTVQRVEFWRGATYLGQDTSAPYTFTTKVTSTGNYTFTAKAFDNQGASTTSNTVTITATR